ncbi:hypothetical protein [Photobacterium sp. DNB22_13_2]
MTNLKTPAHKVGVFIVTIPLSDGGNEWFVYHGNYHPVRMVVEPWLALRVNRGVGAMVATERVA